MDGIDIDFDKSVKGSEVVALREAASYGNAEEAVWDEAISGALCVVTARDRGVLVGIGFVVGNIRHAQMVDLVVHPDYRKRGIGGEIFDKRVQYCKQKGITYLGLTYNSDTPWLKGFYERNGFRQIDFAMWHEDSLKRIV